MPLPIYQRTPSTPQVDKLSRRILNIALMLRSILALDSTRRHLGFHPTNRQALTVDTFLSVRSSLFPTRRICWNSPP